MSELAKAILAFQKDAPRLQRDSINPHFRSKFISLHALMEAVLPELNKQGIILMQLPTVVTDFGPALRTILTHADTGESVEDVMPLQAAKDDPQGQGSALTYARRYALMAALGLVADEDDDGNAATRSGAERTPSGRENPAGTPDEASTGTAPDNPAAKAQAAQQAAKERRTPDDNGLPSNVVVHFGKNKGKRLGELAPRSLSWYAMEWQPGDNPIDRRLKLAAESLAAGDDSADFDIPF